eukprot:1265841-Karenia_brevis.AAC.1
MAAERCGGTDLVSRCALAYSTPMFVANVAPVLQLQFRRATLLQLPRHTWLCCPIVDRSACPLRCTRLRRGCRPQVLVIAAAGGYKKRKKRKS